LTCSWQNYIPSFEVIAKQVRPSLIARSNIL
jgi:hypothetical protein